MFQKGQLIGPYKLVSLIGRGGFGEVWLAVRQTSLLTTKVAVKLPLDDQIDIDAIKREAALWEQASGHPNVLPIIEANIYDDQVVIVSEYASSGSLADLLKERKLSVPEAVDMIFGILAGLEFLHSKQIIHRDLKPANVLLQGQTPRLADFGISRALLTTQTSQSVNITGTPPYMAPEAFDGKRNVQTDIWSVGVIFYYLLSGNLPFPQQGITSLLGAIVGQNPAPLPTSVPKSLGKVLSSALAKNPQERYMSASNMKVALQEAVNAKFDIPNGARNKPEDGEIETVLAIPKTKPLKKSYKSLVVFAALAACIFALILGGAATFLYFFYLPKFDVSRGNLTTPGTELQSSPEPKPVNKTAKSTPRQQPTLLDTQVPKEPPPNPVIDFGPARKLIPNNMLQTARQAAQKKHRASNFVGKGCVIRTQITLASQSSELEQYVGTYRCLMKGKYLGISNFDFEVQVVGEIRLQGDRPIVSSWAQ